MRERKNQPGFWKVTPEARRKKPGETLASPHVMLGQPRDAT